ncbi:EpsG family protein [Sunxiuqinia rutila]|uniref:EpsG family protein n=1 Tax=Sunxiuqinia rutila TaxID=1397841 RepID=UPI003D36039A
MVLSLIIYSSIILVLYLTGKESAARYRNLNYSASIIFNWRNFIPITFFAFIMGQRYDVGIDYLSYLEYYQNISKDYLYVREDMERGFRFIAKTMSEFGFHFFFFFFLCSFIQIFFIYLTIVKTKQLEVLPYIALTLIGSMEFLSWTNGIRQAIAACIIVFSTYYIHEKKLIKFTICVLCASLFHQSAIIFIPIYFIYNIRQQYFNKIWLQLVILVISIYISRLNVFADYVLAFTRFFELINYSHRFNEFTLTQISEFYADAKWGIRSIIPVLILLITILYSKKLKNNFNSRQLNMYYDFYFFSEIMYIATKQSYLIRRPFIYFHTFGFIASAYLLKYLYDNRKKSYVNLFAFIFVIFLFIMLILVNIYISYIKPEKGDVSYMFFWLK